MWDVTNSCLLACMKLGEVDWGGVVIDLCVKVSGVEDTER